MWAIWRLTDGLLLIILGIPDGTIPGTPDGMIPGIVPITAPCTPVGMTSGPTACMCPGIITTGMVPHCGDGPIGARIMDITTTIIGLPGMTTSITGVAAAMAATTVTTIMAQLTAAPVE